MPTILIGVDYRGRATFGCDYSYARALCNTLIEEGQTALLFNINDSLEETLARWPTAIFFVLADTFAPQSPNALRYPQKHGLRKALEDVHFPFIGSSFESFCCSSSANKIAARKHLECAIRIPSGDVIFPGDNLVHQTWRLTEQLGLPVVVKQPFNTGNSIGVSYVETMDALQDTLARCLDQTREPILVEKYISGREFTIWIFDVMGQPACYGSMEIHKSADEPILSQFGKRFAQAVPNAITFIPGVSGFQVDTNLPQAIPAVAEQTALEAHRILGLRHYSRVDLILADGIPFILDVNARPKLCEASIGVVAKARGHTFGEVVIKLVEEAYRQIK